MYTEAPGRTVTTGAKTDIGYSTRTYAAPMPDITSTTGTSNPRANHAKPGTKHTTLSIGRSGKPPG
jgi:hypothetical protein